MLPAGRRERLPLIFLTLPALVIYLAIIVVPALLSIASSFAGPGKASGLAFAGLDNYRRLFASPAFWIALRNNILLAAASVCIQIPLGFMIAYILSRRFKRASSFFRALLFFPGILAPLTAGVLFRFVFPGLIRHYPLLSVFAAAAWMYTGVFAAIFLVNLQRIDESILEAARIDGAGEIQILVTILLPALKWVIGICALLSALFSLKVFDLAYVFSGTSGKLLSTYMYSAAFGNSPDYFLAGTVSSLLALLSLILIVLLLSAEKRMKEYKA
jgi:raffinose/stachyose/melibiose transport system permease protein